MTSESTHILSVQGLETTFAHAGGASAAVKGVSFDLKRGETLGIVGESGSGKSVTALSIMRLIRPPGKISAGQAWFQSSQHGPVDLLKADAKQLQSIRGKEMAMVFQEPMTSLNPVMTCGQQVAEVIILHEKSDRKSAREKTIALFERVKLPRPAQICDSYPHQISGGQKQRVMIAMAMACNPALLIADEPTTALDVTVQKAILDLIRELQEESGMSTLFITHDLGVVAELCDKVLVMHKGIVVEAGTVEDIFNSPRHPYTRGLWACRPRMDLRLKILPTVSDFLDASNPPENVQAALESKAISPEEHRERQKTLQSQSPILEVKGLCTWYPIRKGLFGRLQGHVKAVDDVSFQVFPGETLGLVGESGCGKTTLGRSILRLQEPTSGQVFFNGRCLTDLNSAELRRIRKDIQIIFQDPYASLNPRMKIGEAIMEPMRVHGLHGNDRDRKRMTTELLERVGLLPEHFDRYPHAFSGGQRQRICIARALAVQPKFIICDESVSALDVSVQAQVLNLLMDLRRDFGLTYIFISHDLSVVKFMSDRMAVMNQGKIVELGVADDIYAAPKEEYTRKLIAAIPKVDLSKRQSS